MGRNRGGRTQGPCVSSTEIWAWDIGQKAQERKKRPPEAWVFVDLEKAGRGSGMARVSFGTSDSGAKCG